MNKTNRFILVMLALGIAAGCMIYVPYDDGYGRPRQRPTDYEETTYDRYNTDWDTSYFYEYLSPHGMWLYHSPHGYVWIPNERPYHWRPYTHGRWIWSDFGWTWVSDYEWGWIPFHYGRWGWDRYLGWYWVPGTVWAPAWVAWRWSDFYIGWAPLPPDVDFRDDIGISGLPYDLPSNHWIFMEGQYFQNSALNRYILPYERNMTIINITQLKADIRVRNRRLVNEGPDPEDVRRMTLHEVRKVQIQDANRPQKDRLQADELSIFRPALKKNDTAKPKKIVSESEALEKISSGQIKSPEGWESGEAEGRIRKEQDRERKLLQETQEKDIVVLKKKSDEEKAKVANEAEKEKIDKELKVKTENLKKKHEEEKSELQKRHEEEQKTIKGKTKKKEEK